ncbi:hypothetical protein SELMODRAFT_431787 [Selaginella moellendorffii]|uniref:Uncharacterized protein n=1 Tax=Selaginella moellendorffii TaxID=88036 RepID=D8TDT0_SELML|nr:hypothetical protein SELMODRAFT_431787 [Selaginella moellendorffii]
MGPPRHGSGKESGLQLRRGDEQRLVPQEKAAASSGLRKRKAAEESAAAREKKRLQSIVIQMVHEKSPGRIMDLAMKMLEGPKPMPHSETSEETEDDPGIVERAFQGEYRTVGGVDNVDLLRQKIEETGTSWVAKNRIAPVVTLVQSSGWGKSRTICELASRGVFVVYCSFASATTTYPPRSAIADFFYTSAVRLLSSGSRLVSESRFMLFCMHYFSSCIDVAVDKQLAAEDFLQELMLGEEFWRLVQAKIESRQKQWERRYPALEKVLLEEPSRASNVWGAWEDRVHRRMRNTDKLKQLPDPPKGKLKVLFVMDEAGWFGRCDDHRAFAAFDPARRAARLFPGTGEVVALYTDTNDFAGSNVAPPCRPHSSDRVAAHGTAVSHPAYCFFAAHSPSDTGTGSLPLGKVENLGRLVAYGRPLWQALLKAKGDPQEVLTLAVDKLLGGANSLSKFVEQGFMLEEAPLAILGCRVCLDINPQARVVSGLVARHLLSVVSISDDREHVWTDWAVEPVVAAAAAMALRAGRKRTGWQYCLEKLEDGLMRGWVVDRGYRGELVARVLLLLAVDSLQKDAWRCFTFDELCRGLCGTSVSDLRKAELGVEDEEKGRKNVGDAKFLCLQFRKTDIPLKELTAENLLAFGKAGVGIICSGGIDIIIVGFFGGTFSLETMTAILVKVKRTKTLGNLDLAYAKCSPEFSGMVALLEVPYVSLLVNVADSSSDELGNSERQSVSFKTGKLVKAALMKKMPANVSMGVALQETHPNCEGVELWGKEKGMSSRSKRRSLRNVEAWKRYFTPVDDDLQHIVAIKGLQAFSSRDQVKRLVDITLKSTPGMRRLEERSQKICAEMMFSLVRKRKLRNKR